MHRIFFSLGFHFIEAQTKAVNTNNIRIFNFNKTPGQKPHNAYCTVRFYQVLTFSTLTYT
jgi:hypothetical protein